jgi:hypothetical protein
MKQLIRKWLATKKIMKKGIGQKIISTFEGENAFHQPLIFINPFLQ